MPVGHDPANVPVGLAVEHPEKVGHPDGVPHDIIGITGFFAIILGAATLVAWLSVGMWLAIPIAVIGLVFLMSRLSRRASRERTEEAVDTVLHRDDHHTH